MARSSLLASALVALGCGDSFATGAATGTSSGGAGHGGASSSASAAGGADAAGGGGATPTGGAGGAGGATSTGAAGAATGAGGTTGAAGGGGGATCVPLFPKSAVDATPGANGVTCNLGEALATDGLYAGLDYAGGGLATIDGAHVTSCLRVDFGSVRDLDPVVIRARAVASACDHACSVDQCGTGDQIRVFRGAKAGTYEYVDLFGVSPAALSDVVVTLGAAARYVVVCRAGHGPTRDDIIVDSVRSEACCK